MGGHAGRNTNEWYLEPVETEAFISSFTNSPDPQVSQAAANALEGFHLLKRQ
jgi:hypothetical protein